MLTAPNTVNNAMKRTYDILVSRNAHVKYLHAMLMEEITPDVTRTIHPSFDALYRFAVYDEDTIKLYEQFIQDRQHQANEPGDTETINVLARELVRKKIAEYEENIGPIEMAMDGAD